VDRFEEGLKAPEAIDSFVRYSSGKAGHCEEEFEESDRTQASVCVRLRWFNGEGRMRMLTPLDLMPSFVLRQHPLVNWMPYQ
jgi:hypothetical protein